MKKLLLFLLLIVPVVAVAQATTDGVDYEPVNGIGIKNIWIQDRAHTPEVWSAQPYCNYSARTAVMHDGYIYIAHSNAKAIIQGTDTLVQSVVYKVDATTGEMVKELPLTLNGNIYGGATLSANTVGVDNFGHLFIAPFTSNAAPYQKIYLLDGETGELTVVSEELYKDAVYRIDYIDVMGDLTREQAECNIMAAAAVSENCMIYRWHADQGSDEFEGGFDGDPYFEIIPDDVTQWNLAPVVKMVLGADDEERYSANLFYVDGFTAAPYLCQMNNSEVFDSFENVDPELKPWDVGANGVCEFTLDGRNFIVYVMAQYTGYKESIDKNLACQVNICELGEDMSLAGMQHYWMVPDALGTISDNGTRVESINVEYGVDAEGNEEVTLFIYKCYNGMAVYKIGKNVGGDDPHPSLPGDVNGDGEVGIADVNVLINMILNNDQDPVGDVNGDHEVGIADVNVLIGIILS